jgi:Tfp pilus assembly protein PilN
MTRYLLDNLQEGVKMSNIDFVPDDYVQQRESGRANFMYLVLFAALMGAIGATFSIIKVRQKLVAKELAVVSEQMLAARSRIEQLEEFKTKSKSIMKTAVMTAELLEPVPRSIIIACLTNNLPGGVSLLELKLEQKDIKPARRSSSSQYKTASASAAASANTATEKPKPPETLITINGIAPSNIEVAGYISKLGSSVLMNNVVLVESKEHSVDDVKFQEFRLQMTLKTDVTLTKEDIEDIRQRRAKTL